MPYDDDSGGKREGIRDDVSLPSSAATAGQHNGAFDRRIAQLNRSIETARAQQKARDEEARRIKEGATALHSSAAGTEKHVKEKIEGLENKVGGLTRLMTKIFGYDEETGSYAWNAIAPPTNLEEEEALTERGPLLEDQSNNLMGVLNNRREEDKETRTPIGSIQNTADDSSHDEKERKPINPTPTPYPSSKDTHTHPLVVGSPREVKVKQQGGDRRAEGDQPRPSHSTPPPNLSSTDRHPLIVSSLFTVNMSQKRGDRRAEGQSPHAQNEDEQPEIDIPLDSFSMLFAAQDWFDRLLPLFTFGVQMTILALLCNNLVQTSNRPRATLINIPVGVPRVVQVSQYIACVVSIFSAGDLTTGISLAGKRIVPRGQALPSGEKPAGSWTWEASNLLRTIEGAMVMVVSFVFIVQSSNAIDLWLNFAGVAFVGFLDDAVFALATNNFFGVRVLRLSRRVDGFQVYSNTEEQAEKRMIFRYGLMLGLTAILWALLSVVAHKQGGLDFACQSLTMTVGDSSKYPWTRFWSGTYIHDQRFNQRSQYIKQQGRGGVLGYCPKWSAWQFVEVNESSDPCKDESLRSERTGTYDVMEIQELKHWTGDSIDVRIKCNDCDPRREASDCRERGKCSAATKSCRCNEGFFGNACQFRGPCTEMQMDEEFKGTTAGFGNSFDLLYYKGKPLMVNDRPVYSQNLPSSPGALGVIWFDGGRWAVFQSDGRVQGNEKPSTNDDAKKNLAKYLEGLDPMSEEVIKPMYISEPSDFGSPARVPFRAVLVNTYAASTLGELGDEEFMLLCADCDNDPEYWPVSSCKDINGLTNESMCVEEETIKRCKCAPGYDGPLCYIRPVEGTVSLHLDHGTGTCSVCGRGNIWTIREINGITNTCLPFPKEPLVFENTDGSKVYRQLGIHLNLTHFSVFVSTNTESSSGDHLCNANEGAKEIKSVERSMVGDRIGINYAIHLNQTKDFFGEVVEEEAINCQIQTVIDQSICESGLREEVYGSLLKHAWIQLDVKVTHL